MLLDYYCSSFVVLFVVHQLAESGGPLQRFGGAVRGRRRKPLCQVRPSFSVHWFPSQPVARVGILVLW